MKTTNQLVNCNILFMKDGDSLFFEPIHNLKLLYMIVITIILLSFSIERYKRVV